MAGVGSAPTTRFLDASHEPQRRLTPIQGYEKKDLVSLEKAVIPLEHLIKNIQSFVWTATGNCDTPLEGLTADERAAIYLYTMESMYRQLNKALRSEDRQHLVPYFSYLKLFLTGLWKLNDVKCLVYRGVKDDISHEYPTGKKFVWWGLSSCTTSLDVLQGEQFLGKTQTRTLFNIECFNGKNIRNHSHFPTESEILLLPCSYFEVSSVLDQGHGLHIVHLKQIQPPVTLIEPPSPTLASSRSFQSSIHVPSMGAHSTASSSMNNSFKLNILKGKPKLSIEANTRAYFIAANDEYLLVPGGDHLLLFDKQGEENLRIERNFSVKDICWSAYLNQFLILADSPWSLHSLDITPGKTHPLKIMKQFDEEMVSCTCHNERLLICSKNQGEGVVIEESSLSTWQLKRTFQSPISCQIKEGIHRMQFSTNGSHLGVLLVDGNHSDYHWWFQLRHPNNINILQAVSLGSDRFCSLVALFNEQFLTNTCLRREFFLIGSDGRLKETVDYPDHAHIVISAAFIGVQCLVISTESPNKLHFYHL